MAAAEGEMDDLREAFRAYVARCEEMTQILKKTDGAKLEPDARSSLFIRRYGITREFKELVSVIEGRLDRKKLGREGAPLSNNEFYNYVVQFTHDFFSTREIYARLVAGEPVDVEEAAAMLSEEVSRKS